ncbi:MAG: hypothetical protein JNK17_12055 [Hydrogenophaga sp.]|nr:hypothetical protein [Hydrogenophaga sp.]
MELHQNGEHGNLCYTAAQASELTNRLLELRDAQPGVRLDLAHLAEQLTIPRAKTFANEALGRRLQVVERVVLNVFRIYPPERRKFIESDENADIAIQLHAFAINAYALFDNIAWVCALEARLEIAPEHVGLFKRQCQAVIPTGLRAYLAEPRVKKWFYEYGKMYRDSTAHRIPPYLPPRVLTPDEVSRWKELHAESIRLLTETCIFGAHEGANELLARHEKLEEEKHTLGRNSIMFGLSVTGEDANPLVYLHPQLLSDWGLAHELVRAFTRAMRTERGWPEPDIPPLEVRGPY